MFKLLKPGMWQKGNEENNNLYFENEIWVIRNEKNHERYNCEWQLCD
jgi:hypothetical protein